MRIAVRVDGRQAARPGGSAVTSAAVLLLILAPAVVVIAGADVLHRSANLGPGFGADITAQRPGEHQRAAGSAAVAGAGRSETATSHAVARLGDQEGSGLRLLREAAAATRAIPYRGVQIVSWWTPVGTTTTVVSVAHLPGQGTMLRTADTSTAPADESFVADEPGAQPGAVLGVTGEALDLLAANYRVAAAGQGRVCGRPATVVEARRADSSLAARFWLDSATKVPVRRELFDGAARMINENTFIELDLGPRAVAGSRLVRSAPAARPWNALTAADLRRLRAGGWPLPAHLPGDMTLFSARRATTAAGPVFQLGYSDGLAGLSLFVQRGGLPGNLAGWRETRVSGWPVYTRGPSGQSLAWSSHDHVLTLIADAPATTISAVVRTLPHDGRPGFWARLCHGFGKLVTWLNPFR